ncbi:MAG: hypothetical protein QOD95_784, partial [Gammaproteobacteria bacterium]|nr:hypothetical protein [Gammaproteobacteria bacterium]
MLVAFHRIEEFARFFPSHLAGNPLIVSRLISSICTLPLAGVGSRRWLAGTLRGLITVRLRRRLAWRLRRWLAGTLRGLITVRLRRRLAWRLRRRLPGAFVLRLIWFLPRVRWLVFILALVFILTLVLIIPLILLVLILLL